MPLDTICCICLDLGCNYLTDCCRNKIHKACVINWFIYNGEFNCPLCRSTTTRVPLQDLLTIHIRDYGMTHIELSKNINNLLESYKLPYHVTINIPQEHSCILPRYTVRPSCCTLTCKNMLYLLAIPVFYVLLFFLMTEYYKPNKINTVDYD
jgi:hypothetical protein